MHSTIMLRVLSLLTIACFVTAATSSWGFIDASVSVQGKGTGVGGALKEKLVENKSLPKAIQLSPHDTLKIILTTQEGKVSKRPHQAFLMVKDSQTSLETSYAFSVKESGKGKVDLTYKDIPHQLLSSSSSLSVTISIASFGSSRPYIFKAFDLSIKTDPNAPVSVPDNPLRYGKLPEIHHFFKVDPKSPPKIITLIFTAIVLAALPSLFVTWLSLGANFSHLSKAMSSSPISHTLFFGSMLAMEGIFFMYYTSWNLFQTLPAAVAVGCVTFVSGSRALSEVQERRLAGLR